MSDRSRPLSRSLAAAMAALGVVALAGVASAAETPPAKPKPPPYSLPWQLRPVAPATVVRSDTVAAFYEDPASGNGGDSIATMLLGSYKVTPELAPLVRLGVVMNAPPAGMPAASFVNPAIGATYGLKLGDLRLAPFLGVTLPVGMGGGDEPDKPTQAATVSGIYARSAMDNAMFAVDYLTVFPGVGFAYVAHGFTAQVEATLLELIRVRGAAVQKDETRTNLTSGLHLGYFLLPALSIGGELRYQRWLTTPAAVTVDGALRDSLSFAIGPRVHIEASKDVWFRPGLAYARGIDDPMAKRGYDIVQVDLPFAF